MRVLPCTRLSTERTLSVPVLLKEWLSWPAAGDRIAICVTRAAVYPQETSGALVSRGNGPVCEE